MFAQTRETRYLRFIGWFGYTNQPSHYQIAKNIRGCVYRSVTFYINTERLKTDSLHFLYVARGFFLKERPRACSFLIFQYMRTLNINGINSNENHHHTHLDSNTKRNNKMGNLHSTDSNYSPNRTGTRDAYTNNGMGSNWKGNSWRIPL